MLALSLWVLGAAAGWTIVAIAATGATLDLVDGPLARRSGPVSAFGARFDMETDAFLILTLSMLRLVDRPRRAVGRRRRGRCVTPSSPPGWGLPWMRGSLPPSVRRQTVCVVQIVALIVALAPIVTPPLSTAISAAGLAILAWSFALDVAWLARHRQL